MVKLIAWNIAHRAEPWRLLLDSDVDVALLQEAAEPPTDAAGRLAVGPGPWRTAGTATRAWRTAVVKLSDRVELEWLHPKSIEEAQPGDLSVSRVGTLAAAKVTPLSGEPFVVASMYGVWESPHRITGGDWIYADGSVHRLISDLSGLLGRQAGHRLVAAGDLNILYGYGEHGSSYWGVALRHGVQQDVGPRVAVRRAAGSSGPAGRPVARRTTDGKLQRSHLPHESPDARHSDPASRLCVRLQ